MKKKILIEGMSCSHCAMRVKNVLEQIGGTNIKVNLEDKNAVGDFENNISDNNIKAAIEDIGYDVKDIKT